MKEWFNSLAVRERRMVMGGGVALLIVMLYFLAWQPLRNQVKSLRQSTVEQQEVLASMQQIGREVKALQAVTKRGSVVRGQSILSVVDRTARAANLGEALKRIDPEGENRVQVRLERAPFDAVVPWLESLENQYGIHVLNSTLDAREPGLVDARVVLEGAAA